MEILLHGILRRFVLMGCLWVLCLPLHVVEEGLQSVWGEAESALPASDAVNMAWRSGKSISERERLFSTATLRADSSRASPSVVLWIFLASLCCSVVSANRAFPNGERSTFSQGASPSRRRGVDSRSC